MRSGYRLVRAIAAIADGDTTHQSEVEIVLSNLEAEGSHLKEAVKQLWAGQRDATILTAGLDEEETAVILSVLERVMNNHR